MIFVVTLLPAARDAAVINGPLEEFAVGYAAEDGDSAGCRWWVRGRRGSRRWRRRGGSICGRVSGICRDVGGRPPMAGTWVTSRDWTRSC